jgi:DNA helicase MCM8
MAPPSLQTTTSSSAASRQNTAFSDEEKARVTKLWKTFHRSILDVKNSDAEQRLVVPNHPANFCFRLYKFFVAFLEQNTTLLQSTTTTTTPAVSSSSPYIKRPHQSALLEFYRLAVDKQSSPKTMTNHNTTTTTTIHTVRLRQGRVVVALPHTEFLEELNTFELQGQTATSEFIMRDSFGAFLHHLSHDALCALGCAMALAIATIYLRQGQVNTGTDTDSSSASSATQQRYKSVVDQYVESTQIVARFLHVQPQIPLKDIKTSLVGKFVAIKGHVVKARTPRLRVATADFLCPKCGGLTVHAFEQGRYSLPTKCWASSDCRSRTFHMQRPTARYINVQEWRLQEAPDEAMVQAGRTPRQIVLEMAADDLIHAARPGDMVLVAATVAAAPTVTGQRGKRAQETSTYNLYLIGHSVTTLSESREQRPSSSSNNRQEKGVVYTQHQLESITRLCHADHRYFGLVERRAFPFDLLVRSLCPSIIGHNEVKAGLLLCLLGGTPPHQGSERENAIRSNSHILIVGDPGMGKSQMLLAVNQLAARSVYVGGNTSSTTGLTVTLTKEDRGETGIEAGALVLADQGVCCIDEFDKMAKSHQDGLLEAMEQQQVSIAKAGVVASLPARCSVIAAANPKHGSYNMSKTVSENLNMARPILSRFDLVFILRDTADRDLDRMVSTNIMNLYRGNGGGITKPTVVPPVQKQGHPSNAGGVGNIENNRLSLSERLAWVADFQKEALPATLVRDYIAYAREYCRPKLTAEAAAVLKDYYMELRYPCDGSRRSQDTSKVND